MDRLFVSGSDSFFARHDLVGNVIEKESPAPHMVFILHCFGLVVIHLKDLSIEWFSVYFVLLASSFSIGINAINDH